MPHRLMTTMGATLIVALALTGCAAPQVLVTEPVTDPPAAAPAAPTGDDAGDGDGATASAGSYVDYYDGAIAETPGLKVLFFYAQWCPKCRALDEDIRANTVPDGMTVFKVDFDTELELRQLYGVTLQTTIVYVDDEGELLAKGVLYDDTTLDALLAAAP